MIEAPSAGQGVAGGGDDRGLPPADFWGIALHVTGAHVAAGVPGWLGEAASTNAAIAFTQRVARALSQHPHVYGFDPTATYTLLFQTWDRAISDMRSLAFGRDVAGQAAVVLVPDVYYIDQYGFRALHEAAKAAPHWRARSSIVAWRGSVTGTGPYRAAEQIPRLALATACRDIPGTDVRIVGIHHTMADVFPPDLIANYIENHQLAGGFWRQTDFAGYKFVVDIDGHANAWGLLEKLILGCCVLKAASPYEQWYYDRLQPWVHYVPLRADLSDLAERIDWCRSNDERCAWIARNAARLARSLSLDIDLPRSCRAVMAAADPRSGGVEHGPGRDAIRSALRQERLGSAVSWRSLGCFEHAVADYTGLIESGPGEAQALLGRAILSGEVGDLAAAMADIEAATPCIGDDAGSLVQVARHMTSVNRDAEAVSWFRRAMLSDPGDRAARIDLAATCLRLDWLDIGYAAVRRLSSDLQDWQADLRRVAIERFVERRAVAQALLRQRRAGDTLSPARSLELAGALHSLGRLHAAQAICEALVQQAPHDFAALDLIGRIIWRSDGAAAALHFLQGLPPEVRTHHDYALRVAQRMHDLGQSQDVVDWVGANPAVADRFEIRLLVAITLVHLGRTDAVREHCLGWIRHSPDAVLPARILCSLQRLRLDPPADPPPDDSIAFLRYRTSPDGPEPSAGVDSWLSWNAALHGDEYDACTARAYLMTHYGPETAETFDLCGASCQQAYFRLAWLHGTGGVCAASSEACIQPLGGLLAGAAQSDLAAVRVGGNMMGYLDDPFLAARRGSPLAERALIDATHVVRSAHRQGQPVTSDMLGPDLITNVVGSALAAGSVAPAELFLIAMPAFRRYARTQH